MRWPAPLAISAAVAVALATCVKPHAPAPVRAGREPDIRVGLVLTGSRATVSGEGETAGVVGGNVSFRLTPGQQVTLRPEGMAVVVEEGQGPVRFENLTFVSLTPDRFVTVNGKAYRGIVEAYQRNGGLYLVNRLPVDAYLQGVVSAEMGRRAPNEAAALAAQAIVSRTYALSNRGRFGTLGYDVGGGISDQAYGGVGSETPQGNEAVRRTRGALLTYRGQPIKVFFHSTCGFATAAPEEAFRTVGSEPYLRSVSDRRERGGYYCDISPRFRWQVGWDAATLTGILRRAAPAQLGIDSAQIDQIRDIRVARTGPSGRVTEVRVSVGGGEIPVYGPDLRVVFRTPAGDPLGSTAFQLRTGSSAAGSLTITAAGAGWGHGVGMCQWGAVGRAREGQSAEAIVTTYFPGAVLERWY